MQQTTQGAPAIAAATVEPRRAEDIITALAGGAWDAFKQVPRLLLPYLLPRLPIMFGMFGFVSILHWILLVIVNDGFQKDSWAAPFLAVSGNFVSSLFIYGLSSGLIWSFVFSIFRMGPLGAVRHLVTRPAMLLKLAKSGGTRGTGLFVFASGGALFFAALFLNTPSCLAAALSVTFLGMSRPGMLLVSFLSALWSGATRRLDQKGDQVFSQMTQYLRIFMAGTSPGFLVGAVLFFPQLFFAIPGPGIIAALLGMGLMALGALLAFGVLFPPAPGAGRPGPLTAALLIGFGTTFLYAVFEFLFTPDAWAHDSGWSEGGRSVTGVLTHSGAAEGIARSGADGAAGGGGALVPPMGDEEEPPPPVWSMSGHGAPQKLDAKPGIAFTASFTVSTTDPEGNPAAVAANLSISAGGEAAAWFSCTDDTQDGATRTVTFTMNDVDLSKETPGARSLALHASAPTPGGGNIAAGVGCAVMVGGEPRIVWEFDGGKNAIRPDGKDATTLKAKVVLVQSDGSETPSEEGTESIKFSEDNEWLDISDDVMWDATWKAINCQASDPQGYDGVIRQPPSPVSIAIKATLGERTVTAGATLELLAKPELDVDLRPDTVSLIQDDPTPVKFKAFVTNPGEGKWDWNVTLDKEDFCGIAFSESEAPGVIDITVTPPTSTSEGSTGAADSTKMHIFAGHPTLDEPLERILSVVIAREGLTVLTAGMNAEGAFVVRCDMEAKKEIHFLVFTKDENGKLAPNAKLVKDLWFEDNAENQEIRNLLSVARPEIKFDRMGEGDTGIWTVRSQDFIPGETGEVYRVPMLVRVMGKEDKDEFRQDFTLGLRCIEPDIGSEDWRKELEGCYKAIRFVPEPSKSQLKKTIDRYAQNLGHEGLKLFRKKIWGIAQNLILAAGAEGYKDEALWADRCVMLCDNVKWGTDLVFQAAAGCAFGPVGIIGAPILKDLIEKILVVSYERGWDQLDDWFWEGVTELEQTLDWQSVMAQGALVAGGMVTDPAVLEKILGNSPKQKAAAWAIYVGFQFASNMARGMSMCDAIKQTMRTVRDRVVVQFLMGRMKWHYQMPPLIKDAASRMTGNPPRMTQADMIAIQCDPQMLRSLKNAPPNVQKGFLETYNTALVNPHDAQLVSHVRTLPGYQGRVIRVESFSTPGKGGGGVGADRDFRVTMQNPDGTWSEVPSRLWKDQSNCIVRNLSGRSHQQLNWRATDRFDIEASPDYATQNGQISNIVKVTRGQSTLRDPKQFGNMWQQKMSGVEPGHSAPPLEGVAQAQKACNTLAAVRNGYKAQGYKIGNLNPQMQKGIEIVKGADVTASGNFDKVNQALQNAGFKGGFEDFSNKLAAQFQALGMARKG